MMKTFINLGIGVNSTAILALMESGRLSYENPVAMFADTGAEKPETYEYLDYLSGVLGFKIHIAKSSEGSLWDYCERKAILPMRRLRWCSDRWKKIPLNKMRKSMLGEGEKHKVVIGIDYGEQGRVRRWNKLPNYEFPLIDLRMDREGCVKAIKEIGWKVPPKSGCYFCPYARVAEWEEMKRKNPELFAKVCRLEKRVLERLGRLKSKGWYNSKCPLGEWMRKRHPEETLQGASNCFGSSGTCGDV